MSEPKSRRLPLRVLVVDDSALNRRSIAEFLADAPGVTVVGQAGDGDEALRLVHQLEPDVITLDLEMPRMDGFTFLRILMARRPTPVIVVSGYSERDNVFKALEFGALDFVAKPEPTDEQGPAKLREALLQRVALARSIAVATLLAKRTADGPPARVDEGPSRGPHKVVCIGASTGGPSALLEIFARIPATSRVAVLIAQHMPERFTKTFAERLNRRSAIPVAEATHGDPVVAGKALICPGGQCMELERTGSTLRVALSPPEPSERYVPSVNRLFSSVAEVMGSRTVAAVLTGMGDDGATGAARVQAVSGVVVVESEQTAIVGGMPAAAKASVPTARVMALEALADYLRSLALPG